MKPKHKIWNNSDMVKEFHRLNDRYFDGKLPIPVRIAFVPLVNLGHTFRYRTMGKRRTKNDKFGIHISNKLRYSRRLWYSSLVHELVHLEQRNQYSCGVRGKRFNGRMRQLALWGAFDGIW